MLNDSIIQIYFKLLLPLLSIIIIILFYINIVHRKYILYYRFSWKMWKKNNVEYSFCVFVQQEKLLIFFFSTFEFFRSISMLLLFYITYVYYLISKNSFKMLNYFEEYWVCFVGVDFWGKLKTAWRFTKVCIEYVIKMYFKGKS